MSKSSSPEIPTLSAEELARLTSSLNDQMNILAAECQKLVGSYRHLITDIHKHLKQHYQQQQQQAIESDLKIENTLQKCSEFSHQWKQIIPLVEQLNIRTNLSTGISADVEEQVGRLSQLVGKMEDFLSTFLVGLSVGANPVDGFQNELQDIEKQLPSMILKFLMSIKTNISTSLQLLTGGGTGGGNKLSKGPSHSFSSNSLNTLTNSTLAKLPPGDITILQRNIASLNSSNPSLHFPNDKNSQNFVQTQQHQQKSLNGSTQRLHEIIKTVSTSNSNPTLINNYSQQSLHQHQQHQDEQKKSIDSIEQDNNVRSVFTTELVTGNIERIQNLPPPAQLELSLPNITGDLNNSSQSIGLSKLQNSRKDSASIDNMASANEHHNSNSLREMSNSSLSKSSPHALNSIMKLQQQAGAKPLSASELDVRNKVKIFEHKIAELVDKPSNGPTAAPAKSPQRKDGGDQWKYMTVGRATSPKSPGNYHDANDIHRYTHVSPPPPIGTDFDQQQQYQQQQQQQQLSYNAAKNRPNLQRANSPIMESGPGKAVANSIAASLVQQLEQRNRQGSSASIKSPSFVRQPSVSNSPSTSPANVSPVLMHLGDARKNSLNSSSSSTASQPPAIMQVGAMRALAVVGNNQEARRSYALNVEENDDDLILSSKALPPVEVDGRRDSNSSNGGKAKAYHNMNDHVISPLSKTDMENITSTKSNVFSEANTTKSTHSLEEALGRGVDNNIKGQVSEKVGSTAQTANKLKLDMAASASSMAAAVAKSNNITSPRSQMSETLKTLEQRFNLPDLKTNKEKAAMKSNGSLNSNADSLSNLMDTDSQNLPDTLKVTQSDGQENAPYQVPKHEKEKTKKKKESKNRSIEEVLPDNYKIPTPVEDEAFLSTLPFNASPEIVLCAVNGHQMLPGATQEKPYLRLNLSSPVRIGRSNSQKHPNYVLMTSSQVVSRNHLEIWYQIDASGIPKFYVRDVGSNSGTWVNETRLSEAGVISTEYPLKNGDFIRVGADYKNSQSNKNLQASEATVVMSNSQSGTITGMPSNRHKCIIVRVLCRDIQVPSTPLVANKQQMEIAKSSSLSNSTSSGVAKSHPALDFDLLSKVNMIASQSQDSLHAIQTLKPRQKSVFKQASQYYLLLSTTTIPYRQKSSAIHNITNSADLNLQQLQSANQATINMIGPEIIQVGMQGWGNSKESKLRILFNDMRIPFTVAPSQQYKTGTSLEIVRDTSLLSSYKYKIVLTSGECGITANRIAVQLATLELTSTSNYLLRLCFIPVGVYEGEAIDLQTPGPCFAKTSTPSTLNNPNPTGPLSESIPPIYKIRTRQVTPDFFPTISMSSNFSNLSKRDDKSGGGGNGISSAIHSSDNIADTSKVHLILKSIMPTTMPKVVGEVQSKQTILKSIRKTQWSHAIEIIEESLWEEISLVDGACEWEDYCQSYTNNSNNNSGFPKNMWVYKKEWYTLTVLAAVTYGFLKDF